MKKKKKINKYALGGPLLMPSLAMTPELPLQMRLNGNPILAQPYKPVVSPLNKMGGVSGIASGIGQLGTLASGVSTASTGAEAATQSVLSVFSGASTGAKMGSALGPVGAVVGGAAGAIVGSIGKSGSVQSNGFYEDPTLTLGTGFKGAVQNRKLRRKYNEEKDRVIGNRFSLGNSARLELDWAEDYDNDILTIANGGYSGSSLAYVDDGELINTPDGQMLSVPEEGKPTDSNLVELPEGSKILSDKLKVPGTKETFALMGKKMMSKRKTKGKDKYAENSAKLNLMNDLIIHDQLFNMLESMKTVKRPTNSYADGGTTRYPSRRHARWRMPATMDDVSPNANLDVLNSNYVDDYGLPSYISEGNLVFKYNALRHNNTWPSLPRVRSKVPYTDTLEYQAMVNAPKLETTPVTRATGTPVSRAVNRTNTPIARRSATVPNINSVENDLDLSGETMARVGLEFMPTQTYSAQPTTNTTQSAPTTTNTPKDRSRRGVNWNGVGDIANTLGQLAPVVSNLFAKPESFDTVSNPYTGQILSTMTNRKYDITPARRAIRENRAISNYNASQSNTNTGADMAYRLLSATGADRAIADLYSQASNINNQYKGEYANTLNNLGQQHVQARNMSTDLNARSRAAARNINRTGLSQFSNYLLNRELMGNQRNRDMAMLDAYSPFLESVYKSEDYSNLMNQFRRR